MDVNDSLELPQAIETAISEPTQTRQPNWLLLWLDRVKTSTAILLLCAAGLLAYANSFNGKFVWDDSNQIIHNQKIHSWRGIKYAFTTHIWQFMEETNSIKKVTYSGF